jgi:hypothetical protein
MTPRGCLASGDQAENSHSILDFIFVRTNRRSDNEGERKWFIPEIIPGRRRNGRANLCIWMGAEGKGVLGNAG